MKYLLAIMIVLGFLGSSKAQTPLGDIKKGLIKWQWVKGTGGAADGFIIRCGPKTHEYTQSVRVPDNRVRSYTMVVMDRPATITWACGKDGGGCLGQVFCTVVAYNKLGESTDDTTGVPLNPTGITFAVLK